MIKSRFLHKLIFFSLLSIIILFYPSYSILKPIEDRSSSLNSILIKRYFTDWKYAESSSNKAIRKAYKNLAEKEDYKKVISRGQSRIPIKNNDIAGARRMAITLALRDAVEKGYGFYIDLKNLPNRRQILQQASAQVVYSVIKEKEKGNFYEVTVEAEMLVPLELINDFPVSPPSSTIPLEYKSFLFYNAPPQQAELMAKRAALVDAEANILEIIYDIRINSEEKLNEAVGKDEALFFKVKGFIRGAEVVEEGRKGSICRVKIKTPLIGIQGLGIIFYQLVGKEAPLPSEKPKIKPKEKKEAKVAKPSAEKKVEGFAQVVVDASATGFEPCLYPEIVTEQGMEVYSVRQVAEESLMEKGMASYAVVIDAESWLRERRIPLIAMQRETGWIRPVSSSILPHLFVNKESYTDPFLRFIAQEDNQTLLIKANKAAGRLKGTLVISQSEGERLLAIDEESGLLKDCKVIIVVSEGENKEINPGFNNLSTALSTKDFTEGITAFAEKRKPQFKGI